jgi:hypothetical protein
MTDLDPRVLREAHSQQPLFLIGIQSGGIEADNPAALAGSQISESVYAD